MGEVYSANGKNGSTQNNQKSEIKNNTKKDENIKNNKITNNSDNISKTEIKDEVKKKIDGGEFNDNEIVDNIGYRKGNSDALPPSGEDHGFTKRLGRHKNSKSTTNLVKEEYGSNNSKDGNNFFTDNLSGPTKKSILSKEHDISFEQNPPENAIVRNIDINIKEVAQKIRPLHEDYSQEEIDKSIVSCTSTRNDYELNFYRNGEEIRKSYISKLICKKVWVPSQKEKTHNSLIIFDWDDTLLCTSFLTPGGVFNENIQLSEIDRGKIRTLEFSVLRLLKIAIEKGDVYIITNAGPGWVEFSAEKFYPSIKTILEKITIISARGEYESKYPGDSRKWKIQTFLNIQKSLNVQLVTNIICLGDSFIEMEAGRILASKFSQAFIKTVKFRENPKPEELNKQLIVVANQFNDIYSTVKNLTIRVEKRRNNKHP